MHLIVVIVFGLVMWRPEERAFSPLLMGTIPSLMAVVMQPLMLWAMSRICAARALRRLNRGPGDVDAAQTIYHRASLVLRALVFAGFVALFYLTRWPQIVAGWDWIPRWSALGELIIVSPFIASLLAVWTGLFPADRALREYAVRPRQWERTPHARVWSFGEYLLFNVRHQLLTVAVPMVIILAAYTLCEYHRATLLKTFRFPWLPDALLGLAALVIFLVSPVLLKTIWSTAPLPDGPLRRRLEQACQRVRLRCRDILVWNSHGMMINAAVMGLFPRVRYVLLSDALLEGLDEDGIEAVFGHEAGHIRHHHIQYFLLFALVSVLIVSGVMEILIRFSLGPNAVWRLSDMAIQGIGLLVVAVLWGTVFGWISRRFERQADVFGARCASPSDDRCSEPCGVHSLSPQSSVLSPASPLTPLCATGARIFASALDRVAVLNGIPHEERSWRHSSIGSRMRFLTAQAGDPGLAARFQRRINRIKRGLWVSATLGLMVAAGYMSWQPDYRELIYMNTLAPLGNSEFKIQNSKSPSRSQRSPRDARAPAPSARPGKRGQEPSPRSPSRTKANGTP